jgi:hypothetical protein
LALQLEVLEHLDKGLGVVQGITTVLAVLAVAEAVELLRRVVMLLIILEEDPAVRGIPQQLQEVRLL